MLLLSDRTSGSDLIKLFFGDQVDSLCVRDWPGLKQTPQVHVFISQNAAGQMLELDHMQEATERPIPFTTFAFFLWGGGHMEALFRFASS